MPLLLHACCNGNGCGPCAHDFGRPATSRERKGQSANTFGKSVRVRIRRIRMVGRRVRVRVKVKVRVREGKREGEGEGV
jgi:hypothetical protein